MDMLSAMYRDYVSQSQALEIADDGTEGLDARRLDTKLAYEKLHAIINFEKTKVHPLTEAALRKHVTALRDLHLANRDEFHEHLDELFCATQGLAVLYQGRGGLQAMKIIGQLEDLERKFGEDDLTAFFAGLKALHDAGVPALKDIRYPVALRREPVAQGTLLTKES